MLITSQEEIFIFLKITVYTVRRQTVTEHSLCDEWGYSMEAIYSGLD